MLHYDGSMALLGMHMAKVIQHPVMTFEGPFKV